MSAAIAFGIDGWRARYDDASVEEGVVRIADAAGSYWAEHAPQATVYVGFDTRRQAGRLARLAAGALASHGLKAVVSDRYCPTAAISWVTSRDVEACGALMITGGQKAYDYIGVKLRDAEGGIGTSEWMREIEGLIGGRATGARVPFEEIDLMGPYLQAIEGSVDAAAIKNAGIKVVFDSLYGSARGHATELLGSLGVQAVEIHAFDDPDMDEMRPEPREPWVDDCEQCVVRSEGRAIGIVADGDGERLAAIDELGRFVGPQKIAALVLGHLVRNRSKSGRVVVEQSASTLIRRVARGLGLRLTVRPVGFKYLYEQMKRGDVLLASEDIGGVCIPSHAPERDALAITAVLCELMATTGKGLAQMVDELEEAFGSLIYARREIRLEPEVVESLRTVLPGMNPQGIAGKAPQVVSHMDGLRLEFDDESWLLIRPSGMEPLVRVYAEAATRERRDELIDAGIALAKGGLQ